MKAYRGDQEITKRNFDWKLEDSNKNVILLQLLNPNNKKTFMQCREVKMSDHFGRENIKFIDLMIIVKIFVIK